MNLEEEKGEKNKSIALQVEIQLTEADTNDDEDDDLVEYVALLSKNFGQVVKILNRRLKGTTFLNLNMSFNLNYYNTSKNEQQWSQLRYEKQK